MTTKNWNFAKRTKNQHIEFEGGADEVCAGCTVNLEQNGIGLTVEVQGTQGNCWTGEITSFDNDETAVGDLKVGTKIQFEDNQVFRCAA